MKLETGGDAEHYRQEAAFSATLRSMAENCTNCNLCAKQCEFIHKYGKPGQIAAAFDPDDPKYRSLPFECSLCGLCATVCPKGLDPADMFLAMRREAVSRYGEDFPDHRTLLGYEQRGTSRRYSYYALPSGGDTVFFPGCTLPGTRPKQTLRLFDHLRGQILNLGIVLDCCCKPSHALGRDAHFRALFDEMKLYLVEHGIQKVLVACPNCHKIFKHYADPIEVETVYEAMNRNGLPFSADLEGSVCIHDPCAVRKEGAIHDAVRQLVKATGLGVVEMPHAGEKTVCCGEGGAVGFVNPELARKWTSIRAKEAGGRRIVTYCAGCHGSLSKENPASHILDLMFEPEAALSDKVQVSRAPFTYLNRILLKRRLKKTVDTAVSRERNLSTVQAGSKPDLV